MYKALITDIDGTVTTIGGDGSDVDDSTKDAITNALAANKKIACATGRGWGTAQEVVRRLNFTDLCIIEGGSCIINPITEKVVWEMTLSANESQQILDIFKQLTNNVGLVQSTSLSKRTKLSDILAFNESNRVVYLMRVDADTAKKVKDAVNETDFAVAHSTTPSWYGPEFTDVHVTHPKGTKEHAIIKWQKLMNISKSETIGMGDGENDLPIYQSVGLKIAVGNAHPNLKKHADEVVADYDHGGLKEVIDRFLND